MAPVQCEGPSTGGGYQFLLALLGITGLAWIDRRWRDPADIVGSDLAGQVCAAGPRCLPAQLIGSDWTPWHYEVYGFTQTVYPEAHEQLREQVARRLARQPPAPPAVLHVGVRDLGGLVGTLHRDLKPLRHRVVFVEPAHQDDSALLQGFGNGTDGVLATVEVVNAVLLPSLAEGPLELYGVSPRLVEDMPLLAHVYKTLQKFRSTNRSEVAATLDRECRKFHWLRDCASWTGYIEAMPTRALTPSALLKEAGVVASDIFALLLDATGGDLDLVEAFLSFEGFRPTLIAFKHRQSLFDDVSHIASSLAAKGYDVWMNVVYVVAVSSDGLERGGLADRT